ncbi:MAG: UbiA family prenyltransferase [Candidatus Helarchaeota archaeon]
MKNYLLLLKSPAKILPMVHWILSIALGLTLVNGSIAFYLILLSSLSFIFAWLFAVGINDYYDIEIDETTNPERPLITGALTKHDVKWFSIATGGISLGLAIVTDILNAQMGVIILTGIYLLLGILYSKPPVRLKARMTFSSVVIGIVTSECILLGGVLVRFINLSILYAGVLGFLVTFLSAAKDLKDIEGDKVEGIPTLPVIYGPKKAAFIFQIIYTVAYSNILIFYFFQPLPWYFIITIGLIITVNLVLFQRFKSNPSKENGKLVYSIGFSLYMILTILLLILNL